MTVGAGRVRKQRCVTCRPSEWRAIGKRARAEGMDVSSYILSRVLDGEAPDGPPHPEAGYPMALTGAEQRRQLEILERCVAGCGPLTGAPLVAGRPRMTVGRAMNFIHRSLDPGRAASGDPSGGRRAPRDPGPETPAADAAPRQPDLFGRPAGPEGDGGP